MLSELFIRDLAIIHDLQIEFAAGMTALTGETGAGKSIILDAIGLIRGDRADSSLVRHGAGNAEVIARFKVDPTADFVADLDLEDNQLIVRRVVAADGGSRCYINDRPATVTALRDICSHLVEIHGQHEHFALLKSAAQLAVVDQAADAADLKSKVAHASADFAAISEELDALRATATLSDAEAEMIRLQIAELEPVAEMAADVEELHARHRRLAAAKDLIVGTDRVAAILDADVGEGLSQASRELGKLTHLDPALSRLVELIDSARIHVEEAQGELASYCADLNDDEAEAEDVEGQLSELHRLARKHRVEVAELPGLLDDLGDQIERAANAESIDARLTKDLDTALKNYGELALKLSERRTRAANRLANAVTRAIGDLGMAKGRLSVDVTYQEDLPPAANGRDRIVFQLAANPGQPAQEMSRVASGGELSRLGLALRVAQLAADSGEESQARTLIFDEVDAGVGGAVAESVGRRLQQVGRDHQVFCVTHLPQVAACADRHLRVSKMVQKKQSITRVESLDASSRQREIARMLGGQEITDTTLAHAEEMLRMGCRKGDQGA